MRDEAQFAQAKKSADWRRFVNDSISYGRLFQLF